MLLKGPAEECTVFEMTNEERELITKLHNDFRRKVAKGLEKRGNPGPQPVANNMAKIVSKSPPFTTPFISAFNAEVGGRMHDPSVPLY